MVLRLRGVLLALLRRCAGAHGHRRPREVEKYLSGLASWSADFTQTIDDGHGKVLRSAAGQLYLQRRENFAGTIPSPPSS